MMQQILNITYDPDEAKQILEEAGYKDVDGMVFVKIKKENHWLLTLLLCQVEKLLNHWHNIISKHGKLLVLKVELVRWSSTRI